MAIKVVRGNWAERKADKAKMDALVKAVLSGDKKDITAIEAKGKKS